MLELIDVKKDYQTGESSVHALKGVTLSFRKSEFVAVLGPSGCGKTTMLNILGGLDKYTSGDLIINGRSTKDFKPYDWDAYRNNNVGFVFQSYNLIPHQSVLGNVELALTLSGISKAERRKKAVAALEKVGLKDHINKRPNQLSGGQMQRVAIARAIVNNPTIILADEPTGALDSKTSVQVMEILKEISADRLIVMVTHNDEIAAKYATRTVKLLDGEIISDDMPYEPTEEERKAAFEANNAENGAENPLKSDKTPENPAKSDKKREKAAQKIRKKAVKKTSMSLFTALALSGRNLATKKGRTFMISLAGSIGIIGIALVLAISNGFTAYINRFQAETLSSIPLQVQQRYMDLEALMETAQNSDHIPDFPDSDKIDVYTPKSVMTYHFNIVDKEYVDYVDAYDGEVIDIMKNYAIEPNLVTVDSLGELRTVETSAIESGSGGGMAAMFSESAAWQEMINNPEFMKTQYDVLAGKFPESKENAEYEELAIIVDSKNRISNTVLDKLGITLASEKYDFSSFIGDEKNDFAGAIEYVLLSNDNYFKKVGDKYETKTAEELKAAYENPTQKDIKLKIVGVLRVSPDAPAPIYSTGLLYTQGLTQKIIKQNADTQLVKDQQAEIQKGFRGKFLMPKAEEKSNKTFAELVSVPLSQNSQNESGAGAQIIAAMLMQEDYKAAIKKLFDFLPDSGDLTQEEKDKNVNDFIRVCETFLYHEQMNALNICAGTEIPVGISFYPKSFETKDKLVAYLNAYNSALSAENQHKVIRFTDNLALLGSSINNMVNIISYVLIAFAAISLVVSIIMIAIITYVSVIERTKEIGVLRSIGARKKDITRVFNAETIIIGLIAGVLGILVSYILTVPINLIINAVIAKNMGGSFSVGNLALLNPLHALILVAISVVLTLVSGLIPAFMAAKKDPVVALRTE